ncbi:MAG TPA: ABC transporter ATP-binding protein [Balneolaceae bacterium]|nr:ABC transporter ATP-binding protein [Balneolaceae bacterium]
MNIFKDISHYFRVYREYIGNRLYLVFGLTAIAAVTEAFGITFVLPLIEAADADNGSIDGSNPVIQFLYSILDLVGARGSTVGILVFIGAIFIAKGFLKFVEGAYASYLRADLHREIKGKLFNAYREMDYHYYAHNNTGHFINVINGQVNNFLRSFDTFVRFLSMIIITTSYLSIAFLLTWNFALMAIAVGFVLLLLFKFLNSYVQMLSRKTATEESVLNKFLVQTMQSFKYLTSTNQMQHLKKGVMESIHRLSDYMFRQGAANAFTQAIREPVSVIFLLFVIIIQVAVFNSPIQPIFVALLLFHRGMQHMIGIQDDWQRTMEKIGSLEMVVNEFEVLEKNRSVSGDVQLDTLSRGIRLRDIHFQYDDKTEPVLKGVDLDLPVNRMIAVVGESGAGKSTLIDTLTLLLRPQKGEIEIDGINSEKIDVQSWRSQIGYVSQETVVFDDTIANNICMWKQDYNSDEATRKEIEEAARRAYAHRFISELPDGYNTVVGDRGVRLSGGQRQRLFIARELFKKPSLLILDEATSSLDTESEMYIQKSIDSLKGSMTVVIIAHRLSTIKNADLIYVLDEGRILEQGSYEELVNDSGSRFSKMVAIQSL